MDTRKGWVDDAAETDLSPIRLKSSEQTFSGTHFVSSENVCHERWVVDQSHALMSFRDFLCGPAST